jgi:hypothetical protein
MLELLKIKKDINWLIDQVRCLMRKSDLTAPLSALEWSTNHSVGLGNPYMKDSFVWLEGYVYKSRVDNNEYPPTNESYWDKLGEGHLLIAEQSDWEATSGNAFIRNKPFIMEEAPDNGSQYVRKNEAWNKLTTYFSSNPIITDNVAAGYPLASDWYNTVTGEKFYQKANGVWISYTSSTPPVDGGDSPVVFADYATTTDLLIPYDNGMGGLGATLTSPVNGVLIVDGFTVELGESVLVKDQPVFIPIEETNISYQNGVYILTQAGSISEPFILTRADFADETEELYPSQVNILKGLTNKDRFFLQKTEDPIIGTSDIIYEINYVPPTQVVLLPVIHVDTATTEPLPTCTQETLYLTGVSNGNLGTINGVDMTIALTSVANRKILVKDQVDASQNGDYEVIQIGGPSQPWKLRRITTTSGGFNKNNREWKVNNEDSTLYGNRYYMNNVTYLFIVGTTDITFSELLAAIPSSLQDVTDVGNTTDNDIQFGTGAGVYMNNGSRLKEGSIDAGYGGSKGIAQICAVGYELKWEAGRLYVMGDGGTTVREVSHNFTTIPNNYNDISQGFIVGSRWLLDDGTLYVCTNNTDETAVWELQVIGNQDLQNVTDVGSTTTNTITADAYRIKPTYTSNIVANLGYTGDGTNAAGQLSLRSLSTGTGYWGVINPGPLTDIRSYVLPDESGTIALLSNIPSVDSTPTNGSSNAVSSDGVFDALALKADLVAGKVPASQLPSYVDDVVEVANFAALPVTGEIGKIYVTLDTGFIYRWTGSVYVQIATGGSVTSVGLTMPSAFTVTNSPITTTGDIAVTGAGVASQYVRGDGTLANFPSTSGGGASVSYYLNGSVSQGTIGGAAYKEINGTPVIGTGTDFTINADGYIAQFITDVGDPNKLSIPGGNWNFETYFSASSGGGTPRFYIELYKYDGATFTLIASNSATPENITGGTAIDLYFTALAVPPTVLLATDRLAVRFYVLHSGRTITMHTENSHLSQIITTFSTGLTALNGLTSQVQYLATGTTGTDFGISSSGDTHTFNLPTASAVNRGALSSSDWTAFNNKQEALSSGVNIKTINGNSVLGSGDLLLGVPLTRQEFTFTGSQSFTLSGTPSYIYGVFVQGQELDSDQYSFTGTTLTILNTLGTSNSVNILYTPTSVGVLEYYTKAEVDALLPTAYTPDINMINATKITLMYNT